MTYSNKYQYPGNEVFDNGHTVLVVSLIQFENASKLSLFVEKKERETNMVHDAQLIDLDYIILRIYF